MELVRRLSVFYNQIFPYVVSNVEFPIPKVRTDCPCRKIGPIILLTQLIGINVTSVRHVKKNIWLNPKIQNLCENCHLQAKYISLPSLMNFIFILFEIYFTSQIYYRLKEHMTIFFDGTDYYAFSTEVMFLHVQAMVTLLFARFNKHNLIEMWERIVEVNSKLSSVQEPKSFARLKIISWIWVGLILTSSGSYGWYVVTSMIGPCQGLNTENADYDSEIGNSNLTTPGCINTVEFLLDKLNHPGLILFSQTTAAFFSSSCLIIYFLHLKLAKRLKEVIRYLPCLKTAKSIEELRLLHENLCKATRALERYIGIPILFVACSAILCITCGLYTLILMEGNLFPVMEHTSNWFLRIWCFQMCFGVCTLAVILFSGQLISCVAGGPALIFYDIPHQDFNADAKYQITLFINKITGTPSDISAWNISKINMAFFASVVTNVITYLLVILQFRLSADHHVAKSNTTSTSPQYIK